MKRYLLLAFASLSSLSLLLGSGAKAANDDMNSDPEATGPIEHTIEPHDHQYPSMMRITAIGQLSLESKKPQDPAGAGQVTFEYGDGLVTGELGVSFLSTRTDLSVTDSTGAGAHAYSQMDHYIGIPILIKINYIERPQASLSFKGGIMPAFSVKDTTALDVGDSAGQKFNMSRSDMFAVAGFTGAAPWGEFTEFVIDGAYEKGLTNLDHNGAHHTNLVFGIGVRFDL